MRVHKHIVQVFIQIRCLPFYCRILDFSF